MRVIWGVEGMVGAGEGAAASQCHSLSLVSFSRHVVAAVAEITSQCRSGQVTADQGRSVRVRAGQVRAVQGRSGQVIGG